MNLELNRLKYKNPINGNTCKRAQLVDGCKLMSARLDTFSLHFSLSLDFFSLSPFLSLSNLVGLNDLSFPVEQESNDLDVTVLGSNLKGQFAHLKEEVNPSARPVLPVLRRGRLGQGFGGWERLRCNVRAGGPR